MRRALPPLEHAKEVPLMKQIASRRPHPQSGSRVIWRSQHICQFCGGPQAHAFCCKRVLFSSVRAQRARSPACTL
eukprot:1160558-Pleurochrysis_carterae.AAC.2